MNSYYNPYLSDPSLGLGGQTYGPFGAGVAPSVRLSGGQGAQQSADVNLTGAKRPTGQEQLRKFAADLQTKLGAGTEAVTSALSTVPVGKVSAIGSMIAPAMTAIGEAQAGRPAGAVGALGGGALGALGGAAVGRMALGGLAAMPGIPGIIGKVGQAALPIVGSMIGAPTGAQATEAAREKLTGAPTKGKEAEFSTQMAMRGQLMNQNLDALDRSMATQLQATKDLTTFQNQAMLQQYKAMAPELEKAKMNDFARYQTAMALQGQIQGQLGVLANAGAMAQQGQAGNYGLVQTALTTNPYAGATLQAPQIRFG